MSDLDLTRYEGHTPWPWHVQECGHDTTYQADAYINGPEGCIAGVWGTRKASGQGPNARLIADAPLLLAEVRRLRQSHARLLAAKLKRNTLLSDGSTPGLLGDWVAVPLTDYEQYAAAVAEAEALT